MKYSDWRYETQLHEIDLTFGGANVANVAVKAVDTSLKTAQKIGKTLSGRQKTASQKKIIKTGGIKAARDIDGDGKLEKKRSGGDFQENLLYDVVHDYIIAENFASDT